MNFFGMKNSLAGAAARSAGGAQRRQGKVLNFPPAGAHYIDPILTPPPDPFLFHGEHVSSLVSVRGACVFTRRCVGSMWIHLLLCGEHVSSLVAVWGARVFICFCVGSTCLHWLLCGAHVSSLASVGGFPALGFPGIPSDQGSDHPSPYHPCSRTKGTSGVPRGTPGPKSVRIRTEFGLGWPLGTPVVPFVRGHGGRGGPNPGH